jgi:hypothetical protein
MAEIDSKKQGEDFKYFGHEIRICECYNNVVICSLTRVAIKKKKWIGNWVLVGKGKELEERRLRTREILDLSYMSVFGWK